MDEVTLRGKNRLSSRDIFNTEEGVGGVVKRGGEEGEDLPGLGSH